MKLEDVIFDYKIWRDEFSIDWLLIVMFAVPDTQRGLPLTLRQWVVSDTCFSPTSMLK